MDTITFSQVDLAKYEVFMTSVLFLLSIGMVALAALIARQITDQRRQEEELQRSLIPIRHTETSPRRHMH